MGNIQLDSEHAMARHARDTLITSAQSGDGEASSEAGTMVFVVDDDEAVRNGLERLLRSASYHVETFASAEEFLRRERYKGPACLVLDVYLPGLDGLDLLKVLAVMDYRLPIVFITGHGDVPMGVEAMRVGAVDFLSKPFSDEDLIKALENAMAERSKAFREQAEQAPSSGTDARQHGGR